MLLSYFNDSGLLKFKNTVHLKKEANKLNFKTKICSNTSVAGTKKTVSNNEVDLDFVTETSGSLARIFSTNRLKISSMVLPRVVSNSLLLVHA